MSLAVSEAVCGFAFILVFITKLMTFLIGWCVVPFQGLAELRFCLEIVSFPSG
jgi:hypothetical protein